MYNQPLISIFAPTPVPLQTTLIPPLSHLWFPTLNTPQQVLYEPKKFLLVFRTKSHSPKGSKPAPSEWCSPQPCCWLMVMRITLNPQSWWPSYESPGRSQGRGHSSNWVFWAPPPTTVSLREDEPPEATQQIPPMWLLWKKQELSTFDSIWFIL